MTHHVGSKPGTIYRSKAARRQAVTAYLIALGVLVGLLGGLMVIAGLALAASGRGLPIPWSSLVLASLIPGMLVGSLPWNPRR